MTWLVTGGAGYIGAHIVHALSRTDAELVVLDDLSTGLAHRVPEHIPSVKCSLLDQDELDAVFGEFKITGVVHVAAKKRVDESLSAPLHYYHQNVEALRILLDRCARHNVRKFLFSSSAAVYGEAATLPVTEDTPCEPINPYGQTKLAGEWLMRAAGVATGMQTAALRYFNVAGTATPALADTYAANLVPLVLDAIDRGKPPTIFGDDYPTPDGTCIRDYVHVADVAAAHAAAIQSLERGDLPPTSTLNIGTGRGSSVREVVETALRVTGSDLQPVVARRREGDPPAIVAGVGRAAKRLNWIARHDMTDMIQSTWSAIHPNAGYQSEDGLHQGPRAATRGDEAIGRR